MVFLLLFVYFRIAAVCFALPFHLFFFLFYIVLVVDTKMYEHESPIPKLHK